MGKGQPIREDPDILALYAVDMGVKLELTFYTQAQAEAFVAECTQAGERVALDLEDAEVRAWFDDPGKCVCELTFPGDTLEDLNAEVNAARKVGAGVKMTIPGADQ